MKKVKAPESKRVSTRVRVLSKAMRVVDEESRNEFRDKRIRMLESDNFVEETYDNDPDDEYEIEDDSKTAAPKKKKARIQATAPALNKWKLRKNKTLERILVEQGYFDSNTSSQPNYVSISARKSQYPPRQFCSVCGNLGSYACTRCGSRFCSVKCNTTHQETRCMKMSL